MGCGGSIHYEPEPEDEDVLAIEEKIDEATQYWEERIEPLRAELTKLKRSYEVTLADTTNKRSPPQLGGLGSASRKPVDDATKKIGDTQKEIQRLQHNMRVELADLRSEQRAVLHLKDRIKSGEQAAKAELVELKERLKLGEEEAMPPAASVLSTASIPST